LSRLESIGDALWHRLKQVARDARDAYSGANRYARVKVWIIAAVVLDAVVTLGVVISVSGPPQLEVRFEQGFPANMVIIQNNYGDPVLDVSLRLDGTFLKESVDIPANGTTGFDVSREFMDEAGHHPEPEYAPVQLEVVYPSGYVSAFDLGPS